MKTIFLLYVIAQLVSTAYGICIIEALNPIIKTQLHDKGYTEKNKNSLYKYNDGIINFFKGFIPFYYLLVAVNMIKGDNPIEREVRNKISSGEYITYEEERLMKEAAKSNAMGSKSQTIEPKIEFEKPERYTARKIDNTLYDTYITPVEYVTMEAKKNEELSLTPFSDPDRVIEHVMVKEEVTKEDIVKAISELNEDELDALNTSIIDLKQLKRRNMTTLSLKDVA